MPLFEVLSNCHFKSDFIQNMSQALSKCLSIEVDKWDHLKNPSQKTKDIFWFRVSIKLEIFLRFNLAK